MDDRGVIYNSAEVVELEYKAASGNPFAKRRLAKLTMLDESIARQLLTYPRAQRRIWLSEYKRAVKRARKRGEAVKLPPLP